MFQRKRFPLIRQYDRVDCAPACLLSILHFYKGNCTLAHVRDLCNTDRHGSSMFDVVQAANHLGFKARGVTGTYEDLINQKMPCIAHVIAESNLQHFVVVYKIDDRNLLIGDPGKGRVKLSKEAFLKIWIHKAVILLEPTLKIHREKTPGIYDWILAHLKKEVNWIYQILFLGVIYTLLGFFTAVFVQLLIDQFIPQGDFTKIIYAGTLLFTLLFLRTLSGYFRQMFTVELNKRLSLNINKGFITHLFRLPKRFFDTHKKGDITARIYDSIRIQQTILLITHTTLIDGLIILGSLIFIFHFSQPLGWLTLSTVPLYGCILWLKIRNIKQQQFDVMKSYAAVESTYIDTLDGIDEIVNYNSQTALSEFNLILWKDYQDQTKNLGIIRSKLNLLAELCSIIITSGFLISGAVIVIQTNLQLGEMIAAYSLIANMLPAVNRLVDTNIALQGAKIAGQRLFDLLNFKKEQCKGRLPFKLEKTLKIYNGTFSWPGGTQLFKEINISLEKGKISALWGVSGSGKSTLIQIIQRKYKLNSGQLLIDNTSAESIHLSDYRKRITAVEQNIKIFNATLADNLLCGRIQYTFDDLHKKIDTLGLAKFISRFNKGLFTHLGEDSRKLSGGEKQIIGLIRALLNDPEVLIIDEGLHAIDVEMEIRIMDIISEYARTHLVLLISHNLRTIQRADHIHVLKDGKIIQSGTLDHLTADSGYFSSLWKLYYNNEREMNLA